VADEVRQLAIRAADAARETSSLIEQSRASTATCASIGQQVAEHLTVIDTAIARTTTVAADIAGACDQQRDAMREVDRAVEQVSHRTQEAAATAEESASTAEELTAQAQRLHELVGRFQLPDSGHTQHARQLARAA
jgi:methyl-accepting chemotaxis protein